MTKIENIYDHPNYYSLDDFDGEVWRQIPDMHIQYWVSNLGRVKSVGVEIQSRWGTKLMTKKRLLQVSLLSNRYQRVNFSGKSCFIHKAVALAFLGPRPSPKHQINHKNGIRTDNSAENLEWVTCKENIRHAWQTGLSKAGRGLDRWFSCQVAQYQNGSLIAIHESINMAEKSANLWRSQLRRAINRGDGHAGGFFWKKITKEEYYGMQLEMGVIVQSKQAAHLT